MERERLKMESPVIPTIEPRWGIGVLADPLPEPQKPTGLEGYSLTQEEIEFIDRRERERREAREAERRR